MVNFVLYTHLCSCKELTPKQEIIAGSIVTIILSCSALWAFFIFVDYIKKNESKKT